MAWLPAGPNTIWTLDGNGYVGVLRIDSIGADGKLTGKIYDDAIEGWWDDSTMRITFLRVGANQAWDGYGWQNRDDATDTTYSLAGSFQAYGDPGGGTAARPTYGWVASIIVPG